MRSTKQSSGRKSVAKPRNGGQWTEARFRSFIMSALRRAQWPVKYAAIKKAYVKDGINPQTGRPCKLHLCPDCKQLHPQSFMQADHIHPVVPVTGFDSWDGVIGRLYCEIDGYRAICRTCHKAKSISENQQRKANKQHK